MHLYSRALILTSKDLSTKCLFVLGERRNESTIRTKLPELGYHNTMLKTKRVANFICYWYEPCLKYEKGENVWARKSTEIRTMSVLRVCR